MKFFRKEKTSFGSDKNGGLVLTDYEPLTITITHVLNAKCGLAGQATATQVSRFRSLPLGAVKQIVDPLLYYHSEKFNSDLTFPSSKSNIFKL